MHHVALTTPKQTGFCLAGSEAAGFGEGGAQWGEEQECSAPSTRGRDVSLPISSCCITTPPQFPTSPHPSLLGNNGARGIRSSKPDHAVLGEGGRVVGWAPGLSILLWASLSLQELLGAWGPLCTQFGEWVVLPALLWAPRPQESASSIVPVRANHSATEIAPLGLKNSR